MMTLEYGRVIKMITYHMSKTDLTRFIANIKKLVAEQPQLAYFYDPLLASYEIALEQLINETEGRL